MLTPYRKAAIINLTIFIPLYPLIAISLALTGLRKLFTFLEDGFDWLIQDRWLVKALGRLTDRVERHYKVDPESIRAAWRERMAAEQSHG